MKNMLKILIIVILIIMFCILAINFYVRLSTKNQIIEDEDYSKIEGVDCIIVLGAGVWGDKPSPMLEDRLIEAIKLYNDGENIIPKQCNIISQSDSNLFIID